MSETTLDGTSKKVHPSELNLFHKNPRVGNVDVIKGSLRAHGQYKPILVNKGTYTGRYNEVLAGNHTTKAIRDLAEEHPEDERWQSVDVWEIDVDDDRASRIVVADNRTSELGGTDDEALFDLLDQLNESEKGLEGTAYEEYDLSALDYLINGDNYDDGGESSSDESDQDILDESDQAAWPLIKGRVAPELFEAFSAIPGEDHSEKLDHLLKNFGVLADDLEV